MNEPEQKKDVSFGKREKLKSQKLIGQLFTEGKSLSIFPLKLIFLENTGQKVPIKAAVTVPKKNFKSAVHRNKIKRLLRESYRLNKGLVFNNTQRNFAFLFLYLGKEIPAFEDLEPKMKLLMEKFNARIHEKTSA